jgi:hypothetical protein
MTKFHNTIGLNSDDLREAIKMCKAQDEVIELLYKNAGKALTPWQVLHRCEMVGYSYLIGSVRRGINTLTSDKKLVKLGLVDGEKGKPEHEWLHVDFIPVPQKSEQ